MKKKVFSFDSYLEGIKAFETKLVRGQPSVALSFGTCPFLISESIHYLQKKATLSQIEHRLMDLSEGQGKGLQDLWNQAGLFASHSLYRVRFEFSVGVLRALSRICQLGSFQH